jgi:oxygen-dependent protoporphyrinogen oxidase
MNEMMKMRNPGVPQMSFFISFRNGMYQFVEKLLERIKDIRIDTGTEVTSVTKNDYGRYTIHLAGGNSITADSVVVTTPAYVSSKLLAGINGNMSASMDKIPYIKSGTISLVYKKADIEKVLPRAFGFLVPGVEERQIMAATFTSLKWPHRCPDNYIMLRCFAGGKKNQHLIQQDDETLLKIARDELKSIIGIEAEPVTYRIFRWIDNMPQYNIGHQELIETIDRGMQENRGLYVTGSAYRGIGIPDCINNAEITARKIAEEILT